MVFLAEEKAAEFGRSQAVKGDLVFTCWGTIGQVGLIDERARFDRYIVSNKQMKLTPDPDRVDPLFLYYAMSSPSMVAQVQAIGIGSSVPGFNLGQLRQLGLELPPLAYQRAVADVLGALDDKIEANRRAVAVADRVLRAWFVVATESGEYCRASSVLQPILGGTPSRNRSEFWGGPIPWASAKDVAGAEYGVLLRTAETISSLGLGSSPAKVVPAGTTLITARGTVGKLARTLAPCSFNQTCYALVPVDDLPQTLLYFAIRDAVDRLMNLTHGTIFATITKQTFDVLDLRVPSRDRWDAVASDFEALDQFISTCLRESATLVDLRNALLPKLLSGELLVRDPASLAEAAV
jgi:type I restriction enzyme S subunit